MRGVRFLAERAASLVLLSTIAAAAAPGAAAPTATGGPHGTVQHDVKSGKYRLVAQGSPVEFQVYQFCRYVVESNRWSREKFAPITKVVGAGTVAELTDSVGLYWVKWKENGLPFASLVLSSPVLCNDIRLGSPPSTNMISACIPFGNTARAAYVPDPKDYCG